MPPAKKDTSKPASGLDGVIEGYTKSLKASVDAYADLARNAVHRIAGDEADQPSTSWADDAASYLAQVAKDQAEWVKAVNDVVQGTTKKGSG